MILSQAQHQLRKASRVDREPLLLRMNMNDFPMNLKEDSTGQSMVPSDPNGAK